MKFFRLDLLTLLISLFILNSCKNQDTVGLGVNSPAQINGNLLVLTDTSIIINTVPEDSVVTYSSSGSLPKNPLAYFNDPIFGLTTSDLATDINLPGNAAYTLPNGVITIDSALLVLKLANGFYGDSLTSNYAVNVYQLASKFNTATTYYNTSTFGVSSLIGSHTFNGLRPLDSIMIKDIVVGAPDTFKKVPPQLRIPINPSFITNNLLNASSTTLSSNAIFQNNVKGLYIQLDRTKTTGAGGTLMIAPSDSIAVYYRANNGGTIDTAVIYLPVSNFAASIDHHKWTPTIQTELSDTTTSRNLFYLQGLGGLRARVRFPHFLVHLRDSLLHLKNPVDIVINRAELVITPNIGSATPYIPATDRPYSPIPKLTMYRLDIAHQRSQIEDASSGDPRAFGVGFFGGFYNPPIKQYHFLLTAYFQDQLLNRTVDYGTYIAPIDNTNTNSVDIQATPQIAARTVAVGTDNTSPLKQYQIRLNVIYTKVSLK